MGGAVSADYRDYTVGRFPDMVVQDEVAQQDWPDEPGDEPVPEGPRLSSNERLMRKKRDRTMTEKLKNIMRFHSEGL